MKAFIFDQIKPIQFKPKQNQNKPIRTEGGVKDCDEDIHWWPNLNKNKTKKIYSAQICTGQNSARQYFCMHYHARRQTRRRYFRIPSTKGIQWKRKQITLVRQNQSGLSDQRVGRRCALITKLIHSNPFHSNLIQESKYNFLLDFIPKSVRCGRRADITQIVHCFLWAAQSNLPSSQAQPGRSSVCYRRSGRTDVSHSLAPRDVAATRPFRSLRKSQPHCSD